VNNNNGTLRIILNKAAAGKPWLGLRLVTGKRDAYGARLELKRSGLPAIWRRVRADGSYLSANDPRVLIGLGNVSKIDALTVHWSDGKSEAFEPPPLGQYTTLVEGTGKSGAGK